MVSPNLGEVYGAAPIPVKEGVIETALVPVYRIRSGFIIVREHRIIIVSRQ